jgi:hypothetical protein
MASFREDEGGIMKDRRSGCRILGLLVLAGAVVLAGCGSKGGGTPTGTSSNVSAQTIKRVDVHVAHGTSAEAPRSSMLANLGHLFGWPQEAWADAGVPGCTVSGGGASATTDANGNATLTGVTFPTTINVTCPNGQKGSFPVTGPAGSAVKVEVEVGSIDVHVKSQHVESGDDQGDDGNEQGDDVKKTTTGTPKTHETDD